MYKIGKEEAEAVSKVIASRQLFRYRGGEGGHCDRFEANLAKKTGVKHTLLTSSGTGALICAMVGIGIGPGDEVIVPAYTFMATPLAVLAAGGIPILAEVNESLMLDPEDVEKKISRHTKAIVPVHMLGHCCDMKALMRIARKHRLHVIEDACQAVGGSYRGKRLGSIGHAGAFSFNQFKNISCGEGGAVLTNDDVIYDRSLLHHDGGCVFRAHAERINVPFFAGLNFRASELLGAIMSVQLKRLDGILKRLRQRQALMKEILGKSEHFRLSPSNEDEGDCGSTVHLLFESDKEAKSFVDRVNESNLGKACRPIDTDLHVYTNWEPVLKKRGSHCSNLNPFEMAKRKIHYSADMCPRTLDILSRTAGMNVPFDLSLKEVRSSAKSMVEKA